MMYKLNTKKALVDVAKEEDYEDETESDIEQGGRWREQWQAWSGSRGKGRWSSEVRR